MTGIGERDGTPRLGAVAPLQPGDPDRMGRYVLSGRLGAGGMGTVYLGRAQGGGPQVAVKVVHPELAGDPEFRSRFADEVAAARRVAPFCTARVVDADTGAARPYLVTEFVDGVPLGVAVAESGPLDPSTLQGVALGVAAALAAVHAAGVVHRDLKPGNVLLSLSGPRVIDFGIARALDVARQHTQVGMLVGTPGWMAPEQFRGGSVGPPADVFSWGSLVAYAATGRNPWQGGGRSGPSLPPTEQAYRILHVQPALDGLTGLLRRLVESALDKDPARRPTARQLVDALLGGGTAPADPTRAAAGLVERTWTGLPVLAGPTAVAPGRGPRAPTRALPPRRPEPTRMFPPTPPAPAASGASPARPARRRGLRRARPEPPSPVRPVDAGPGRRRRRWWLRKRLLLPLGLLALVVLLGDRGQGTPPPAGGSQLGVPVRDGNLEFVVSQVRCGVTQVGTGVLRRAPKGQFCLARMRVTNVKTDARTLFEPVQKLVDTAGGKHGADIGVRVIYRDQTLWDKVEPGKEVSGTMVFDIPRDTRPDHLELHDGIASGGVTVRLR